MLYDIYMTDDVPGWWPYSAQYPSWQVWRDVDRLYYARLDAITPPLVVRGEDAEDLRDQIRATQFRSML